jgi:hypothetical protein
VLPSYATPADAQRFIGSQYVALFGVWDRERRHHTPSHPS